MAPRDTGSVPFFALCAGPCRFIRRRDNIEQIISVNTWTHIQPPYGRIFGAATNLQDGRS